LSSSADASFTQPVAHATVADVNTVVIDGILRKSVASSSARTRGWFQHREHWAARSMAPPVRSITASA